MIPSSLALVFLGLCLSGAIVPSWAQRGGRLQLTVRLSGTRAVRPRLSEWAVMQQIQQFIFQYRRPVLRFVDSLGELFGDGVGAMCPILTEEPAGGFVLLLSESRAMIRMCFTGSPCQLYSSACQLFCLRGHSGCFVASRFQDFCQELSQAEPEILTTTPPPLPLTETAKPWWWWWWNNRWLTTVPSTFRTTPSASIVDTVPSMKSPTTVGTMSAVATIGNTTANTGPTITTPAVPRCGICMNGEQCTAPFRQNPNGYCPNDSICCQL